MSVKISAARMTLDIIKRGVYPEFIEGLNSRAITEQSF